MSKGKSLIIDVMRLIDDIPFAFNLLKKEGLAHFLKRFQLYFNGVRIPAIKTNDSNTFQKKIIYCFNDQSVHLNKMHLDIPKKLQYVYGYETAVLVIGKFNLTRILAKFWFFRHYPNNSLLHPKLLNDLTYLVEKSYSFALVIGTHNKMITRALDDSGIRYFILGGNLPPLPEILLKLVKAEPTMVSKPAAEVIALARKSQAGKADKREIALILHLYYSELWGEISQYLNNIPDPFDLYVSLNPSVSVSTISAIHEKFPDARLYVFENRGRDVFAFLKIFQEIRDAGYRYICKIHTKQSPHFQDTSGVKWRNAVFESLLGSKETVNSIIRHFDANPSAGIIAAEDYLFRYQDPMKINGPAIQDFAERLSIPFLRKFYYPAGTMFWFRPQALCKLTDLHLRPEDFPEELSPLVSCVDGTAAHAVERLVALAAQAEGFCVQDTKSVKS
jgi:hypothetical protein